MDSQERSVVQQQGEGQGEGQGEENRGKGERVPGSHALLADGVLSVPLEERKYMWENMDDNALLNEVASYYDALHDVTKRIDDMVKMNAEHGMVEYGSAVHREGETGTADGMEGSRAVGKRDDVLGVEGVDYYEGSLDDVDPSEWHVPPYCIPIHANVVTYDWKPLWEATQFDVIMMDPPWQLATANPTRGVALGYSQLTDRDIENIPIPKLQQNGFLFIWVINAKYQFALDLFDQWGYTLVDEIVWVKMTVNRRLAKSHGFYLQHAKEVCLVGKRGEDPPGLKKGVSSDIIYSERRGQSQKPEEIYELIEEMVPNGRYLEIFGRKNNLRSWWTTIGNESTGTGLPPEHINDVD